MGLEGPPLRRRHDPWHRRPRVARPPRRRAVPRAGPSWCRAGIVAAGDHVDVRLEPEGPQLDDLGPELRAALDADPVARRAFESLATFYRKQIVREVDGAKRQETRDRQLAEAMDRLRSGAPAAPDD